MTNSLKCKNNAIGLDIGGTKVKIACIDSNGRILWSQKEPVVKESSTAFLKHITGLIKNAVDYCASKEYRGIGIALPAVIAQDNDTIIQAPNLTALDGIKLNSLISKKLRLTSIDLPIRLGFDGKASVIAEAWQGAGRNHRNILTITIGTGIGGGLMVDGQVVSGYNNVAGAIGWTRLGIDGKTPSFENVCAGPAIAREAKKLYGLNTTRDFFDRAERAKRSVADLLEVIISYTGLTVANLVSIFNPEVIIFAGSVGLRFKPYLDDIKEIVQDYAQPVAARDVKLTCSKLGSNAGVIGAAGFVLYDGIN